MPMEDYYACIHYCGKVNDYKMKLCCFPTVVPGETKNCETYGYAE